MPHVPHQVGVSGVPVRRRRQIYVNRPFQSRFIGLFSGIAAAGLAASGTVLYYLLRSRIEDNPQNSTRFLVIGRRPVGPTGRDKTSILFAMRNEPGSLYRILEPLARAKINLTKIESRPARQGPWEYVIFVDLEGHRDTDEVAPVLAEIGERTLFLKVLGSYPAA